ncbi:MAG TPA: hypothetical protein VD931_17630 [Baekduia sp.]|nr:hypothetical protein [Baekduia sp.]
MRFDSKRMRNVNPLKEPRGDQVDAVLDWLENYASGEGKTLDAVRAAWYSEMAPDMDHRQSAMGHALDRAAAKAIRAMALRLREETGRASPGAKGGGRRG